MASNAMQLLYKIVQGIIAFTILVLISSVLLCVYAPFWVWATFVSYCYAKNGQKLSWQDVAPSVDYFQTNSISNGFLILKGTLAVNTMQDLVTTKIIDAKNEHNERRFPVFSQQIVEHCGYWFWEPKQNFNIKDHIRYYSENPIQTEEELKKVTNDIVNQPIPLSRPLWEILFIPCLIPREDSAESAEPQTLAMCRVHHAMGDGFTFLQLIVSQLSDNHDELKLILEQATSKHRTAAKSSRYKLATVLNYIHKFICTPICMLPPYFIRKKHMFHGPKVNGMAAINWTSNIKLQTVKDIKNSTSTTVNDVITSCIAGAIRRYFLKKKATPPNSVQVVIPVNLKGINEMNSKLNNKLSFVLPKLPTGEMDCLTRLEKTKFMMDELKTSPEIVINHFIWRYLGSVFPISLIRKIYAYSPYGFTLSNIPGPGKIYLAGHEVNNLFAVAPMRSSAGVGIAILSYRGFFNISVTMDSALISDPNDVSMLMTDIETEVSHLYHKIQQ